MKIELSLVMIIVNNGYSEEVMELAKSLGAKGGTIFSAFGSAKESDENLYGIKINKDKEIILITVLREMADKILEGLYQSFGLFSKAQGIAFTLPIEEASSNLLNQYIIQEKE